MLSMTGALGRPALVHEQSGISSPREQFPKEPAEGASQGPWVLPGLTSLTTLCEPGSYGVKGPNKLSYLLDAGGSILGQSNGLSAWTPPGHPTSLPFAEKGLDIYLIIGICGGGSLLMVFVALLVFYITKRKKQRSRRNGKLPLFCPTASPSKIPMKQLMGMTP